MAAVKQATQQAQQPLILRAHRLMEAFAKSDDERDFYIDRQEGFILYADLDKSNEELGALEKELIHHPDRYCMIPKLTFYEAKKIMEGFVNEKVYDIDTKEKLLDIIQSKEARSNFLEFLYDHHAEYEKWQQYYQERSRIRIIEWLRQHHFHFVFEEDLEFARNLLEKLKQGLFETKIPKDVLAARKILVAKARSYYSTEALNPRPKRGRPPKQAAKQEVEPQITTDIYLTVPSAVRPFLFSPEISSASAVTFSADFGGQGLVGGRRQAPTSEADASLANLQNKLAELRQISSRWVQDAEKPSKGISDSEEDEEEESEFGVRATNNKKRSLPSPAMRLKSTGEKAKAESTGKASLLKKDTTSKPTKPAPKSKLKSKAKEALKPTKPRKKPLRPLPRMKREAKIASTTKPKKAANSKPVKAVKKNMKRPLTRTAPKAKKESPVKSASKQKRRA